MYKYIKRLIDIVLSIILLIILSIPIVLISIFIKLDSKGPIIFKQERVGYKEKYFKMYKFRSMVANNDVHDFSCEDQHTKIGSIIRKTSLDELPQLINILKGEMSFIGPRPWIDDYYKLMTKEQKNRYKVRPGITGLAQINGRNNISINDKINYDIFYVNNMSLFLDIKIFFMTIVAVFKKTGADAGKFTIKNELEQLKKEV